MIRAALFVSALLAGPVLVTLALADEEPAAEGRCGAAREGAVACMAGRTCLCRHERGGQMAGRPGGFRWDCGPLRPDCAPAPAGEAAARDVPAGLPGPLPWTEPQRLR